MKAIWWIDLTQPEEQLSHFRTTSLMKSHALFQPELSLVQILNRTSDDDFAMGWLSLFCSKLRLSHGWVIRGPFRLLAHRRQADPLMKRSPKITFLLIDHGFGLKLNFNALQCNLYYFDWVNWNVSGSWCMDTKSNQVALLQHLLRVGIQKELWWVKTLHRAVSTLHSKLQIELFTPMSVQALQVWFPDTAVSFIR